MSTDRRVTFLIGANAEKFRKEINNAQKKMRRFGRKMQRIGSSMTQNFTVPLGIAAGASLKAAADFEKLRVQLETLTGSAEKGSKAFERLKKFSAGTPFQLKNLVKANNTLMGFGRTTQEAYKDLQLLGDVAAVTGGDLQAITVAFGQSAAEGRLMTRDIRQLINQGVPAIKILAESMGVAQSSVLDLASQGEISFRDLREAMKMATEQGGMFANGTEQLANTLHGVFSTLKDNVMIALGEIGNSMVETFDLKGLARSFIDNLKAFTKWFGNLSDEAKRMGFGIATLLAAGGPVLTALGAFSAALGAISFPATAIVAGVATAATMIIKHWDDIVQYFTTGDGAGVWKSLKTLVSSVVDAIQRLWGAFGDDITSNTKEMFNIVAQVLRTAFNGISVLIDTFTGRWITDWEGYSEDTAQVFRDTFGQDGSLQIIMESFLMWARNNWAVRLAYSVGTGIGNLMLDALREVGAMDSDVEIPSISESIARSISSRRAKRDLRRAKQELLEEAKPEDKIIEPEIDVSLPDDAKVSDRKLWNLDADNLEYASVKVQELGTTAQKNGQKIEDSLSGMTAELDHSKSAWEVATQGIKSNWEQFLQDFKEVGGEFSKFMASQLTSAVSSFATSVGKQIAGVGNEFQTAFEKILVMVADFAVQLGKILISIGSAMLLTGILSGPGGAYLAAGGALVALGTAAKASIKKKAQKRKERQQERQGMAFGGVVPPGFPNDSYPAMLTSGEKVVPPPKKLPNQASGGGASRRDMQKAMEAALDKVDWRLRGPDIVKSYKRTQSSTLR